MEKSLLLILVIAILALSILQGYRKGLVYSILDTIGIIAAIVIAALLTVPISSQINKATNLDTKITKTIVNNIDMRKQFDVDDDIDSIEDINMLQQQAETDGEDGKFKLTKLKQKEIVSKLPFSEVIKDKLNELIDKQKNDTITLANLVDSISKSIGKIIVNAICFIVLFIIALIVWKLVIPVTKIVNRIPLVGGINQIGGAILGGCFAILKIWIIFVIITMFSNAAWARELIAQINDNSFLTWLYQNNQLVKFVTNLIKAW